MTLRTGIAWTLWCAATLLPGACVPAKPTLTEVTAERDDALRRLADEQRKSQELDRRLQERQRQVETLQALGDKRLERLFHVAGVSVSGRSGGVNTDGRDGDDGVKVILEPMDQDGSVLKAAGAVKIQVFDLAAPPEGHLVAECDWPVDKVATQWYGGFVAYHYSFVCPWKTAPRHEDLTLRVEFTDYLTGRTFSAQRACKVRLATPPATSSAPAQ